MKQNKISFGKILVFLSFFIIIIGAIISIGETTGYVDTSNNIIVPHSDDKITVTTSSDSEGMVVNDDGMIVSSDEVKNTDSGNNNHSNTNTGGNKTGGGNTGNGGNKPSGGNSTPSNPTPSQPVTPSTPTPPPVDNTINIISAQNAALKNSILNSYGINVLYGNDTNGYSVGGLSTSVITDVNVINSELNALKNNLALYPSGFFREITSSIPLTIYLINKYSREGVCGVTDSNYSRAIMSLASGTDFVETFHHENYHYMERYIFKRGGGFPEWSNYNPIGFVYGQNKNYAVYNLTYAADVYFVNTYARDYDEFEDRASVFEYMMAGSKASCLNAGMPVNKKATYMSSVIEQKFNSCSPSVTEHWERFIK